ncbi:MAG: hydantoinase B/oxoprolinase family protein [Pseudomonadota bacterium]
MTADKAGPSGIDPVTVEVVSRHVLAAAEEMGVVLMRTAFSPNIKERHDCSTAVFDAVGEVVAQAQHVPIHLGSMIGAIEAVRARVDDADMRPGDMFVANDPYNGGGSHLPDLNVVAPVFHDGRIAAFVANIAHHADVGGMVPGSEAAICESIFQEGLRLPPVRLVREGCPNRDIIEVICLNSRTPEERKGDLNAQIAANRIGVRAISRLIDRYGVATYEAALESYLDYSERRMRAALGRLEPGTYGGRESLSGDGDEPVRILCTATVGQDRLILDFDGTDRQITSARNVPMQALSATVYTVMKAFLDPDAPANGGAFRVVEIRAPEGSVVNPTPPAPVGARSISCGVVDGAIVAALSAAMPQRRMAASGPHHLLLAAGTDPRTGRYFVNYETVAGALGARASQDGMDAVRTLSSGSANLPVEALEHAYPLRVEQYALRIGSGGAGRYRGGDGMVRDYRVLTDDLTVSLTGERQTNPAEGIEGGKDGATGAFLLDPDTKNERRLPAAVREERLAQGTVLRIATPGGGGFGPSGARSRERIARDVREERLAAGTAASVYGWTGNEDR